MPGEVGELARKGEEAQVDAAGQQQSEGREGGGGGGAAAPEGQAGAGDRVQRRMKRRTPTKTTEPRTAKMNWPVTL